MKTKTLIMMFALLVLMTGCNKNEIENFQTASKSGVTLSATIAGNDALTKVGFEESGDFYWSSGDRLGVTDADNTTFYPLDLDTEDKGKATGIFTGEISDNEIGKYAVYPYNSECSMSGTKLTYNFPAEYTYNHVDDDYFTETQGDGNSFNAPMWGAIDAGSVQMKHLGGVFCIKIADMPCTDGTLILTSDRKISGTYTVDLSATEEPQIEAVDGATDEEKTVSIAFSNATVGSPGVFYVPAPVGIHNVTVILKDSHSAEQFNESYTGIDITRRTLKIISEAFVNIPDANFKKYLVENFDTDKDGEISLAEAEAITFIDVCTDNIESLEGIEAMKNLEYLHASGTISVSPTQSQAKISENHFEKSGKASLSLKEVFDNDEKGSGKIVRNAIKTNTYVSNGKLTSLDVSNNTELIDLRCSNNQLTSLDVSNNTELIILLCGGNQLTSLDVSSNTELIMLYCFNNQLTSLDVSNNTELTDLSCGGNQLTSLDVSNNTALTILWCYSNQLTSLDISNNTALTELSCDSNQLTSLDISNNTELIDLSCCNNQLTSLDVSNNTALTELWCFTNQLTSLDVSNNTALEYLYCDSNQLTSLDVSNNTELTELHCSSNQLTSLDVSNNNTALEYLYCYHNQLTSLDVSNNTALTELWCYHNQLTSLDVSNNTALTELWCYHNQLTGELDVSNNTALQALDCWDNQLTSLDVSNNTALTYLVCGTNQLTSLDVSNNTALTELYCYHNQLTSLDVSNNTALTELYCYHNQLTSLDVSNNTELTWFSCQSNPLTSLDVSNNTALEYLYCTTNQLISLDVSNNIALKELWCWKNQLTSLDISNNINLTKFNATGNPDLKTIYVWDSFDIANPPADFHKDDTAEYKKKGDTNLMKI